MKNHYTYRKKNSVYDIIHHLTSYKAYYKALQNIEKVLFKKFKFLNNNLYENEATSVETLNLGLRCDSTVSRRVFENTLNTLMEVSYKFIANNAVSY